jgi:TRAP-type C4-dicarboxylate transport system substrate-binding protein
MPIETFMSKVPIRTLDDFKGVSVRASGASAALLKALGAQPVSMPSTEIYTAFQTGTIQAGEYSDFLVNWEAGIHEVTDYIIEPALHHCRVTDGGGEYMVNRDAWDALPDEYKAILEAACEENATNYLVSTMPKTAEAKQKMIDYGLEVITLPDEDVHEAYVLAQTTAWTWLEEQSDLAGELMEILYEYIELFGYEVAD